MPACIDRFSTFGGAVIIIGWSSDFAAGDELQVIQDDCPMLTTAVPQERPDVAAVHGPDAANWGFRAYGIAPDGAPQSSRIGLRFANGAVIESLAQLPRPADEFPHGLWMRFIDEANTRGGTVLEIGSRARSGNTHRGLFGSSINYIGFDITAGPNVDIVGDAHALSAAVAEPVDFIFSISTFEHFLMPWKVVLEMNKILRPGGLVYSHSHQTWPSHDEPWDYFRFSKEAWASLFNQHTGFKVVEARRGESVAVASYFNWGGPFENMEHSPGWANSVCMAEKIGDAQVSWDADASDIAAMEYQH